MKSGVDSLAFTIVEVLIFLAVSGTLLFSAMGLISSQQRKTEFRQSIREIQTKIDDVINNTTSGYYNFPAGTKCQATGAGPVFSSIGTGQGTNKGCIFIGRAIQFGVGGNKEKYSIYSIAGLREKWGTNEEVTTLADSAPRAIVTGYGAPADATERNDLQYGLKVKTMYYTDTSHPIGAVGFFTTFAKYGSAGLDSGSKSINVVTIPNTDLSGLSSESSAIAGITSMVGGLGVFNPPGGVGVCFEDSAVNEHGTITIGASGANKLATTLDILAGTCP